jgi:hypothetical protein
MFTRPHRASAFTGGIEHLSAKVRRTARAMALSGGMEHVSANVPNGDVHERRR